MLFLAYKTVLQSYGLDSNPSSEADANSDLEMMDDVGQSNHMNDTLNNMYMNNKSKTPTQPQSNDEAIDISSDESDGDIDELPTTTTKNSNSNNTAAGKISIFFIVWLELTPFTSQILIFEVSLSLN